MTDGFDTKATEKLDQSNTGQLITRKLILASDAISLDRRENEGERERGKKSR